MGKKRRGPSLEELLARPWCYYCERDFDDLKILLSHQKAKHFKCERCGRRLNTAGGLSVHMSQVHKEQLSAVENALPNRSGLDVEIFGMEGVPEDVLQGHNSRVITQYQQAEAERQAVTGNPPPGATSSGPQPAKKPKLESPADLKKRLAEHKAKKAEMRAGGSSGEATPVGAGQSIQTPGAYSPQTPAPATASSFGTVAPPQQYAYPQPYSGAAAVAPYPQSASPAYPAFFPGAQPPFSPVAPFSPSTYTPAPIQPGVSVPPPGPTYASAQQTPASAHVPPQSPFPRPGSLPAAPSLPQRPSFGAPSVNAQHMQQMHMGGAVPSPGVMPNAYGDPASANGRKPSEVSVDNNNVFGAGKPADEAAARATPQTPGEPAEAAAEKASKKDKGKPTRLVYSDNEVSPEEKLAKLPRYAFVPDRKEETTLGGGPDVAVTGTIRNSDTVYDAMHH